MSIRTQELGPREEYTEKSKSINVQRMLTKFGRFITAEGETISRDLSIKGCTK